MTFADLATVAHQGGERQAALMLHGLRPADQAWLVDQLAPAPRQRLRDLLGELDRLGVAPDACRLLTKGPAVRPATGALPSAVPVASDDRTFLMHLAADGVSALAQALRWEPASLVAQCLHIAPWPWAGDLIGRLPAVQRRQIEELRALPAAQPVPAARAAALQRALRERCATVDALPVAAPAAGRLGTAGWRRWLGSRFVTGARR